MDKQSQDIQSSRKRGRPSLLSSLISQLDGLVRRHYFPRGILPSEHQLAALMCVSRTPVRRLIRFLEKERKIYRTLGDQFILLQPPLPSEKSPNLIYITDWDYPDEKKLHFPGNVYTGIQQKAKENGWQLVALFGIKELDLDQILSWLPFPYVDGIIISEYLATNPIYLPVFQQLAELYIPFIVIGNAEHLSGFHRVSSDQYVGAKLLMERLWSDGARFFFRVGMSNEQTMPWWLRERDQGYRDTWNFFKEKYPNQDTFFFFHNQIPPFPYRPKDLKLDYQLVQWLVEELKRYYSQYGVIDALLLPSDAYVPMAREALRFLRCQHPTRVCGFDNFWQEIQDRFPSGYGPDYTVDTNQKSIGELAFKLLEQIRQQDKPNEAILLRASPSLVIFTHDEI